MLADRIAIGPEALREVLVDHRDRLRGAREVRVDERSTLDQRDLHGREVIGCHSALIDLQLLTWLWGPALDADRPPSHRRRQGQRRHGATRRHTWY